MTKGYITFFALAAVLCFGSSAFADVVAQQDFDSNNDALAGSFDPSTDNQDGGPGDFFGVGNRNAWPQGFPSPGVPFSIADDSVFGYGNGSPFAADDEGIFGENSDLDNNYFAISDSDQLNQTATWIFDISGFTNLQISLDIGADIDGDFAYDAGTFLTFAGVIDGGGNQTFLNFTPATNTLDPGSLRPLDGGSNEDPIDLLFAAGDATITKTFASGGTTTDAADLYLDKSLVADGSLDNYKTSIAGTGSTLTLTMTANFPFEAAVFDNILIEGQVVPEPASATLLGLIAVAGLAGYRRRMR